MRGSVGENNLQSYFSISLIRTLGAGGGHQLIVKYNAGSGTPRPSLCPVTCHFVSHCTAFDTRQMESSEIRIKVFAGHNFGLYMKRRRSDQKHTLHISSKFFGGKAPSHCETHCGWQKGTHWPLKSAAKEWKLATIE